MDRKDEKIDKVIQLLEEILKWTRIEGMQRTKTIFDEFVKTDLEKLVYENSNGQNSREVGTIAQTSHTTVINYWKKWSRFGIIEEVLSRGGTRYKRVFSLSDFGIEVPQPKTRQIENGVIEQQNSSEKGVTEA